MRPKTVGIVLLATLAVLVLAVVLKKIGAGSNQPGGHESAGSPVASNQVPLSSTAGGTGGSPVATTPDQDREVQKENDLEALRQALLKGSEDPTALPAVVGRLANPNAEVRAEAVDAAIHLGDTNAIPALNNAVQHVEDPHEKVALLQAVAYLSLPSREATPRTNVVREPGKKPFKARRPNAGPAARFGTNQVPGIGVPGQ